MVADDHKHIGGGTLQDNATNSFILEQWRISKAFVK